MSVDIEITYKLKNSDRWTTLKLTPEQYFDPDPEEEEYEVDSVPVFLDARDYLKEQDENITNLNVFLKDPEKNAERVVYSTYWNNGQNILHERKDKTASEPYHEMIISLTTDRGVYEILRLLEENGAVRPIMHTRIFDHPDGSQSEINCLR